MIAVILLIAAALAGAGAIACELVAERGRPRPRAFLLLKPLTTGLIALTLVAQPQPPSAWLLAAYVFALAGDIALMFEGEAPFLLGLGSFFVAHLALVAVFAHDLPGLRPPTWSALLVLYALAFFFWLLPRTGALKLPVLAYGAALTAMMLAAAAAHAQQPGLATRLTLAGTVVFAASDSALAVRQFHRAYRAAQPLILSTYWVAIALIAVSHWPALA